MKTSPLLQQLVEQLAAKHDIDLTEPGRYLRLALPDHPVHLIIETTDARQVIVGCYAGQGTEEADPYLRFAPHSPTGWLPIELQCALHEWEAFLAQADLAIHSDDADEVDLADFSEYWARQLLAQGWLLRSQKRTEPHGRLPGCQSTHQGPCYGELWQCAACGKTVCCAEGTDDRVPSGRELCDDCWAERFAPVDEEDAQAIAFTAEDTLTLVCDCPEQCGAWLELTPEGMLALEDKDGLRVSLLLPDWLDDVMRTAIAAHAPGADTSDMIGFASPTAWPAPTVEEPDLDTLAAWLDEGVCETTDGCLCELDGYCAHGHPSWFLVLGLI